MLTVATQETDGFRRFLRSAKHFNYTFKVKHFISTDCFEIVMNEFVNGQINTELDNKVQGFLSVQQHNISSKQF